MHTLDTIFTAKHASLQTQKDKKLNNKNPKIKAKPQIFIS